MRDIKFRAYDDTDVLEDVVVLNNKTILVFNGGEIKKYRVKAVVQYTGMKDKNGAEIYDGDTIKCTDGADEIDMLDSNTGIGCVEWNDIYGFWSISKIENGLGDILQCGYVEIIGNVHEPEPHT